MRAYELLEKIGMDTFDKENYLMDPNEVVETLVKVLGRGSDEFSRGELSRVKLLFDKPKLRYTEVKRLIQGGWGNDVWSKFVDHVDDRFVK